jgi:hypothetical protein
MMAAASPALVCATSTPAADDAAASSPTNALLRYSWASPHSPIGVYGDADGASPAPPWQILPAPAAPDGGIAPTDKTVAVVQPSKAVVDGNAAGDHTEEEDLSTATVPRGFISTWWERHTLSGAAHGVWHCENDGDGESILGTGRGRRFIHPAWMHQPQPTCDRFSNVDVVRSSDLVAGVIASEGADATSSELVSAPLIARVQGLDATKWDAAALGRIFGPPPEHLKSLLLASGGVSRSSCSVEACGNNDPYSVTGGLIIPPSTTTTEASASISVGGDIVHGRGGSDHLRALETADSLRHLVLIHHADFLPDEVLQELIRLASTPTRHGRIVFLLSFESSDFLPHLSNVALSATAAACGASAAIGVDVTVPLPFLLVHETVHTGLPYTVEGCRFVESRTALQGLLATEARIAADATATALAASSAVPALARPTTAPIGDAAVDGVTVGEKVDAVGSCSDAGLPPSLRAVFERAIASNTRQQQEILRILCEMQLGHNDEIASRLGFSADELCGLVAEGSSPTTNATADEKGGRRGGPASRKSGGSPGAEDAPKHNNATALFSTVRYRRARAQFVDAVWIGLNEMLTALGDHPTRPVMVSSHRFREVIVPEFTSNELMEYDPGRNCAQVKFPKALLAILDRLEAAAAAAKK